MAETVTTYVVQHERIAGADDWYDVCDGYEDLQTAGALVRGNPHWDARQVRIVERRVTTVEEVMP